MPNIRVKGADGEREALRWFQDNFDLPVLKRNLEQVRGGGADCLCIPHIALEVKRQENLELPTWWRQTVKQALVSSRIPVLMYRQNRKQWMFALPASLIVPTSWGFMVLRRDEFKNWFQYKLNGVHHEKARYYHNSSNRKEVEGP